MRAMKSLAAQLKREEQFFELSEIGSRSRLDRSFHRLWLCMRLRCELCDGYLVVRGRSDRKFRFAGCSNYTDQDCRFTLTSKEYVQRKAAAIDAILAGDDAPFPVLKIPFPARYARMRGWVSRRIP